MLFEISVYGLFVCYYSAIILRMVSLLSYCKIMPTIRNMCRLHYEKRMDNSSFRLVNKPVLHSWEDSTMENKPCVHRKTICQQKRIISTRLIKKLDLTSCLSKSCPVFSPQSSDEESLKIKPLP